MTEHDAGALVARWGCNAAVQQRYHRRSTGWLAPPPRLSGSCPYEKWMEGEGDVRADCETTGEMILGWGGWQMDLEWAQIGSARVQIQKN